MNLSLLVRRLTRYLPAGFRPSRKKSVTQPLLTGLPQNIDLDLLEEVCMNHFSKDIRLISHQHLSAWKSTGAYRLFVDFTDGSQVRLIYKEANYNHQEIPALEGLPVRVGIPEFLIYQLNLTDPSPYLPSTYIADEVIPGKSYRYILEDLAENHERISPDRRILNVVQNMDTFHDAMNEWASHLNSAGLIQYGYDFSKALETYAWSRLDAYSQQVKDKNLSLVLKARENISSVHLDNQFHEEGSLPFIHGDMNYSNIHINRSDPNGLKIVDWEWAGFGYPQSDLVALTKGASPSLETEAFQAYLGDSSNKQDLRKIFWCRMERALLDASFLAAQVTKTTYQANFNLHSAVSKSLNRLYEAYRQIVN